MLIGDSVDKVHEGSNLVEQAGATMAEITAASVEQSAGIAHVSQTIVEMERATQQNAARVEAAAAPPREPRLALGEPIPTVQ